MTDKSEAQKRHEREQAVAFAPEPKATQADIDKANARHSRMPDVPPQVFFTELGWAVCRGMWIIKLFDSASNANDWLKRPELVAA